jgi:hypothetical protein
MADPVDILLALTESHLAQSAVYATRCEERGPHLDQPAREVLRAHQFAHRAAANKLLKAAKELQAVSGVKAVAPQGYALVPVEHTIDSAAWDRMCLALCAAMKHPGYNEPSDVEAANKWRGNASHVVRSIIAAGSAIPGVALAQDTSNKSVTGD